MPVTRDMLLSELKELQRLTAFEQAVATVRRTQAAGSDISAELAANAAKAGERLALLGQAVRGVGGAPDVVGPVLGKAAALLQTQVNQVQTLQGALLGDLALEHQLRERARYARTLAVSLGESRLVPVLDRLDAAHTETIAWLEQRLSEVARTGSSALRATPVQVAVGHVRHAALAPFSAAASGVNKVGGLLGRLTGRAPAALEDALETVHEVGSSAVERGTAAASQLAGRAGSAAESAAGTVEDLAGKAAGTAEQATEKAAGTAEQATEAVAGAVADTAASAAEKAEELTHEVLEATGGDDVADAKPPFAGYERLTGDSIMRHVEDTGDVEELRTLLAFEQAHKARKGVLKAAQDRLEELSVSA